MRKINSPMKYLLSMFIILLFFSNAGQVYAASDCQLLQIVVNDNEVVSYIECDSDISEVNGQIAQYSCENIEICGSENISIHTIIMLDNSLSITENNRANIKNILKQYAQGMTETEMISLATFGEDIQFLTEKSQDMEEILQSIDAIEFYNQDTYLTDYLFQLVEEIKNAPEYTRFIIISDGVDNKAIGITKEELIAELNDTSRPIYTIGHIYKDNSSELKNMFALSRLTVGKEFLIEDFEDISLIADEIHDFSGLYSVKMEIPREVMDGDKRSVLLNISTNDGEAEVTGEVAMPFTLAEKTVEVEPEPTPEPAPEPTPKPAKAPTPEPVTMEPEPVEEDAADIGTGKILVAVILLIVAVILLLYQQKMKNNTARQNRKSKIVMSDKPSVQETFPVYASSENETTMLEGRYLLVLRDRVNPERIFRYPMDQKVIIGRNIDKVQIAIDYSLTVSGQHCEFYIKNNRFYLRDMNSANHTYLDEKMVNGEVEVVSGNVVRLGEVEFSIEILPI